MDKPGPPASEPEKWKICCGLQSYGKRSATLETKFRRWVWTRRKQIEKGRSKNFHREISRLGLKFQLSLLLSDWPELHFRSKRALALIDSVETGQVL